MAPEVMMGRTLDEKTDVYSFGLILWEIATLKEPFQGMTSWPVFRKAVCEEGLRPPIPSDMLPRLKALINRCWDAKPAVRPSFAQIITVLEEILVDCAINDEIGRDFWYKSFKAKETVPWEHFSEAFAALLGLPPPSPDDLNFICLKAILGWLICSCRDYYQLYILKNANKNKNKAKQDSDPTLKEPPYVVTLERFGAFLGLFGPLSIKATAYTILDKVTSFETTLFIGI